MNVTPLTGSPVYLSGPMFSAADLWQQAQIAAAMEAAGYTTYLPQRDGIEVGAVMGGVNSGNSLTPAQVLEVMTFVRKIVFALDIYQLIARCQSLVFNMDGRVPDDGSVVEVAAGFTAGKPIVVFKTTPISELGGFDNPMIQGLSTTWSYVSDVAALPAAVASTVKQTAALGGAPFVAGAHLAAVVTLGAAVWQLMPTIRAAIKDSPAKSYQDVRALQAQLQPLLDKADGNTKALS